MQKMDLTPVQLMHDLESAEQSLTEPGSINFTGVLLNLNGNLRVETRTRKRRQ